MKFKNEDYVECNHLPKECVEWVLGKMYEFAGESTDKENSETIADYDEKYHILKIYGKHSFSIYFSNIIGYGRDITAKVLKKYNEHILLNPLELEKEKLKTTTLTNFIIEKGLYDELMQFMKGK